MAKALIMLVRLLSLAGFVLGAFVWNENRQYLSAHIAAGFLLVMVIFVLAVLAMIKKAVLPGILGVVLAFLLPVIGFLQFPLTFHTMRAIQALHIVFALAAIGAAEALFAAIRRAGQKI